MFICTFKNISTQRSFEYIMYIYMYDARGSSYHPDTPSSFLHSVNGFQSSLCMYENLGQNEIIRKIQMFRKLIKMEI